MDAVLRVYLKFRGFCLFVHNVLVNFGGAESFFWGAVLEIGVERCILHLRLNSEMGGLVMVMVGTGPLQVG